MRGGWREGRGRDEKRGKEGKGGDPKGWFTPLMFEILKNAQVARTTHAVEG